MPGVEKFVQEIATALAEAAAPLLAPWLHRQSYACKQNPLDSDRDDVLNCRRSGNRLTVRLSYITTCRTLDNPEPLRGGVSAQPTGSQRVTAEMMSLKLRVSAEFRRFLLSDSRHNPVSTQKLSGPCSVTAILRRVAGGYRSRGCAPARKLAFENSACAQFNPDRDSDLCQGQRTHTSQQEPDSAVPLNCMVQRRSGAEQSRRQFPGIGGHLRPGTKGTRKNVNTDVRFDLDKLATPFFRVN